MIKDEELVEKKKNFKQKKIKEFLDEYAESNLKFTDERIKLCSSDDFNDLSDSFKNLQKTKKAPIMISQVGGFYVMASLAGHAASNSRTKPVLLFFDRKTNNVANAIYNTLLMQACDTKEEYIATLFGLDEKDIIISLDKKKYIDYIIQVYKEKEMPQNIDRKRIKIKALRKYRENQEEYDEIIAKEHDLVHRAKRELEENFNIANIEKYARSEKYDKDRHLEIINKVVEGKLSKEHKELFDSISRSMTEYLAKGENYDDLVKYLSRDIQINSNNHILCNNNIYNGYKSLINKKGQSSVKFVPGIDITTDAGMNKLEYILQNENLIDKNNNSNKFPIDIAFLPHVETLQEAFPLLKRNVERFIKINREGSNSFSMHPTATLHVRTYESIGAKFIEEERKARKPLKHLTPIETQKGFPKITFLGGANYGNIYNSEEDLNNVIEMAIADKADTAYIQGLIYSTYYHNQTDRRMLIDPKYQTLDQRLKAAKKLIKRLNDNGIRVVYQMGDEEYHLYQDMFSIYTKEQGVTGKNFLAREDKKSAFDWVRPIIIQELIPYLIRSGEDLTNFYTDEEQETRVTELCTAIKNYREGLPLGELAKYIKPEYLQDTDMFRVVYSTIDNYDEKDPALSVNLLSNPNFSSNTQYSKPTSGIIKNLKIHQTGALGSAKLKKVPQVFADGRQSMMSISYRGEQVTINTPQMIDDAKYIEHPELLSGIKEHISADPTHARVTKPGTRPNYPGSWTITGDAREKMTIAPYYKRVKEVMEHVNKTGKGLEEIDVFYLNDVQVGSLTERLEFLIKALDHFYYDYPAPAGIIGNGDFQHGWNYKGFPNESRHLSTMSTSQQMVDFVELIRPYIEKSFGVIKPTIFKGEYKNTKIDNETCADIMNHLRSINIIDSQMGKFNNNDLIKDGIDYKTVDLKLPPKLKPYEEIIREKLSSIKRFKFIHLAQGNHEYNSDWDKKGTDNVKFIGQELDIMNKYTGANIEVAQNEFIVNKRGDILQAPHGCKTINGYNTAYAHMYKLAKGDTPTMGMARYFDRMGDLSNEIHRAVMGHLHVYETSVIDNKLYTITGCAAGQSGFEQEYGLAANPIVVIDRYLPDGRMVQDTIGPEFIKNYKIQNPEIKRIGLDNFISMCLNEEAAIYGFDGVPENVQQVHQRRLVIAEPNKIIGPKID